MTVYVLFAGLLVSLVVSSLGFTYIYFRSKSFHDRLPRILMYKYIILGWFLSLLACLSSSALIALWSQVYTLGSRLVVLSLVISLFLADLIVSNCLFTSFLNRKHQNKLKT